MAAVADTDNEIVVSRQMNRMCEHTWLFILYNMAQT